MKLALTIAITLVALVLANTIVIPPMAKLEQLAYKSEETTLRIQGVTTVARPYITPGEGYQYAGMKIEFLGVYPSIQIAADGQLARTFDQNGFVTSAHVGPDATKVTLVNTARGQIEVKVRITYIYVKTTYVPLAGETVVEVNVPDGKLAAGFSAMAKLTIEPYAPYVVKSVETPTGAPASVYRVEPKVVEMQAGRYKVYIAPGDAMPAVMLVKSLSKQSTVVSPGGELVISGAEVAVPQGWKLLGYAIFAYTGDVTLVGKEASGDITIEGGLVDVLSDVRQNLILRSVSYLIPPVWNVNIRYKVALVYGEQFKVSTSFPTLVNLIYIPIVYKPAEVKWLPDRALVNVTDGDLSTGQWTAIVLQLPELARVASIRTPNNAMISNATDVNLVWGSGVRAVSISPDGRQAYIVVQMGETREAGVYTFVIDWRPMKIAVVDTKGRPVGQLSAAADKFEATTTTGFVEVRVYKPEPFTLDIQYRGVNAARVVVNSLVANPQPITLGIYTVKVTVVGVLNQPIAGAAVAVAGFPTAGETDQSGGVVFQDVLAGRYKLTIDVGGRVKSTEALEVSRDVEIVVKTPVLAMLGGFPVTTFDALATVGGLSAAGLYFALARRREAFEVEQI